MEASEEKDQLQSIRLIISDEALIGMSVSKLNGLIKSHGLSKESAMKIKSRRRRLLNRGYASKFREKRRMEDMDFENENKQLEKQIDERQKYREKVENETTGFSEDLEQKKTDLELLVEEERLLEEVPEVIESLENPANNDDEADESKERPENVSRFIGEVRVNPDPFQLIEQIREEDFSDSESDSSPIFYDSDSSDLVELEYTETVTYWARFDSSENED